MTFNNVKNTGCKTTSQQEDKKIALAIVLQFCLLMSNYAIKEIMGISDPAIREKISFLFMIIVGIMYVKNLNIVLRRIGRRFISVYVLSGIIIMLSWLLSSQNIYLTEVLFGYFVLCLPNYLYYMAINDKEILLQYLLKSSYYQIIVGLALFAVNIFRNPTYDMVFSYLLLVPVILLTYKLMSVRFNLLDALLVTSGISAILILGSRGPLLSYIVFIIILFLDVNFKGKRTLFHQITSIISAVAVLLILGLNIETILFNVDALLKNVNIQSRTLNMMYMAKFYNTDFSSGRLDIYKKTLKYIAQKPILGYGIAGDRVLLNGTYPHNIMLEILAQFGIVVGGIIIVIFMFTWIRGIFLNKKKTERHLAIIFMGIGLVQLFVSGSYLTSSNFWLFMASCTTPIRSDNDVL